jgi:hypothetical protein
MEAGMPAIGLTASDAEITGCGKSLDWPAAAFSPGLKAQSLQDKTFSAGLKTRCLGVKSGGGTFFRSLFSG